MALHYGEGSGVQVVMEGPFGSVKAADKASTITMLADAWKCAESPYFQEVNMDEVSANSIVDLQPDADQFAEICRLGIAMFVENDSGTIIVHSIGGKPEKDLTMQVRISEVIAV